MVHGWKDEQVGISFQLDHCVSLLFACHSYIRHKLAAFSRLALLFLPNCHTCKKEPIGCLLVRLSNNIIILMKSQTDRVYLSVNANETLPSFSDSFAL